MRLFFIGFVVLMLSSGAFAWQDSDADGVPDLKDACAGTPKGFVVYANGCDNEVAVENLCIADLNGNLYPQGCQQVTIDSLYYALNSDEVSYDQVEKLLRLSRFIQQYQHNIYLVGYADISGETNYNAQLSLARAHNIKQLLVEDYGVVASRIEVQGRGSQDAKYLKDSEMRAYDRRVDFFINK
ncbi:OmpA family protein [Shewanella gelidii]|nr:OmpA family protein [Shewanella gelidii]MCL1097210.1 OmpA family protein [Shewanella gelidii]